MRATTRLSPSDPPEVDREPGQRAQVFCHSGFEYPERPTAFIWQDQRLEIDAIQATWQKPGFKCFLVNTTDGQVFELCYDQTAGEWRIQQP